MRKLKKILLAFLLALAPIAILTSCGETSKKDDTPQGDQTETTDVDYVAKTKLTDSFSSKDFITEGIEEVDLYQAVDGDTIHVVNSKGTILKLRFLGVDTPESTATVEPWGKKASAFTKNIVKNCKSLVIQSDGGAAKQDNYERYLSWVWYKMDDNSDYRLLNLELVQEGYSYGKSEGVTHYVNELTAAQSQAMKKKIRVYGETDPDYCYGAAKEIALKELCEDLSANGSNSKYLDQKVMFEATVVRHDGATYYLNDTDPETGVVYGIQVYHNKASSGKGYLEEDGNRVKIAGTVTYYETGDVYQLTSIVDAKLQIIESEDNLKLISSNYDYDLTEISASDLNTTNADLLFNVVSLKNIAVTRTYTTTTEGSSSYGAITITGTVGGQTVTIRTTVLFDRTGTYLVDDIKRVKAENFDGKTIDVIGIVERYNGSYQIKLVSMSDVVFK